MDRRLSPLTLVLLGACATTNRQTVSTPAFEEVMATCYMEPRGGIRWVGFASAKPLSEQTTDCFSRAIRRWSLRADRSRALRRGQVVVRREELLERWAAQNAPAPRPVTQGRRGGSRR
jgi:hypothetical protein